MSVTKHFNEQEARVVEALLRLYYANRIAVADVVKGQVRSFKFREYVDGVVKKLHV